MFSHLNYREEQRAVFQFECQLSKLNDLLRLFAPQLVSIYTILFKKAHPVEYKPFYISSDVMSHKIMFPAIN